jgi:hypothetical protein
MKKIEYLKIGDIVSIKKDIMIDGNTILADTYELMHCADAYELMHSSAKGTNRYWWLRAIDTNIPHWLGSKNFKIHEKALLEALNYSYIGNVGDKVFLDSPQAAGVYYIHLIDNDFYYLLPVSTMFHVNLPALIVAKEWLQTNRKS